MHVTWYIHTIHQQQTTLAESDCNDQATHSIWPLAWNAWNSEVMSRSAWWLNYPSENIRQFGMMTFPTEWEHKSHVPVTTNQRCLDSDAFPSFVERPLESSLEAHR